MKLFLLFVYFFTLACQIFKKTCPALPFGNPIDHHQMQRRLRGKFLTFNKKKMARHFWTVPGNKKNLKKNNDRRIMYSILLKKTCHGDARLERVWLSVWELIVNLVCDQQCRFKVIIVLSCSMRWNFSNFWRFR